VFNLRDGLRRARLLRTCPGLRILWLRKLWLFKRRLFELRIRGGGLFDLWRRRMRNMRLCASGMFKLRRLCIRRLRRCFGAGDEPRLFHRAGRCSDAELSNAECFVSSRGSLCDARSKRSHCSELRHADIRRSDPRCARAIGGGRLVQPDVCDADTAW
jgi:hypothetical protein